MKKSLKVRMMTVAATGLDVLSVQAIFLSNKDLIGTGKMSMVIPLTFLLLQPAIKKEKC